MRFGIIHRIALTIIAISALMVAGWFGLIVWGLVGAARLGPEGIAVEAGRLTKVFDSARQGSGQ